uniref:Uncharacterized protein n=1 Tax=mine drainage metagenome TaxID=410659 RepID=E6PDZ7_9ZZZZ
MSALVALTHAELITLVRRPAFVISALCILAFSTLLLPAPGAAYSIITYDGRPGLLLGGAAGSTSALLVAVLLGLVAFFVFGGTIRRDRRNGFGRFLAALAVPTSSFVVSRAVACAIGLLLVALGVAVVLCAEGVLRNGASFGIVEFLRCYVPTVTEPLVLFGCLAVIIDAFTPDSSAVRVTIALVAWFGVLASSIAGSAFVPIPIALAFAEIAQQAGPSTSGMAAIGYVPANPHVIPFHWTGLAITAGFILSRVYLILASFAILWLCSLAFDRFKKAISGGGIYLAQHSIVQTPAYAPLASPLRPNLVHHIVADLACGMRAQRTATILAIALAAMAALIAPWGLSIAKMILLLDAIVISRILWLGEFGIPGDRFTETIAGCARDWVLWKWLDIFGFSSVISLPVIFVALIHQGPAAACGFIIGMAFIAALLSLAARWSGGAVLGLAVAALWWYVTALNTPPPVLDIAAIAQTPSALQLAVFAALVAAALAVGRITGARGAFR